MSNHKSVSSENENILSNSEVSDSTLLDAAISSESEVQPNESDSDLVEEGFEGVIGGESLEKVAGFDESRALYEGLEFETEEIIITEDLERLPDAGLEEFQQPESVCGRDDRIRISPATAYPWRAICQLIITMANGSQSRCTGWFIGPRTVMTAGHCVYSHTAGGWPQKITVIPGMDAARQPFGFQVGTSFRSVLGWTRDKNWEYDYGAIILPNNTLGNRVGWFGFADLSTSSLRNLLINNSGYPADKPFGTQWFNAGRISRVTDRKLFYMVDTYGGQSGSAIWRFRNGQRHAVGIHGYGGCPNSAVRIIRPVFDNMLAWKRLGL
jgi:V8-like Glu-specific endopeptidase